MSKVVNVHAAKTHLSKLIEEVLRGEEVVIARSGVPVARLVAVQAPHEPRRPGGGRGQVRIGPDFDLPLPPDVGDALGV
jgi:prevent-host-death family protein